MPDVSVVIPAFNRVGFLTEAIQSCLAQTYTDIEVIVVDDGSTEELAECVDLLSKGLAHGVLRYVRQPHSGANAARNRGLVESNGEFVQFLDSDDLLHRTKLEVARQLLLECPNLDMVFGLDEHFHDSPGDMRILWNTPGPPDHLDRFLWDDPVWHTGSPLWRRDALGRIGPWNESLVCWQDWEFHIRALCRGITYSCIPSVLAYLRDHDQSRSTNLEPLLVREHSKLEAAILVANQLKGASLWTGERGDALAVFLLSIAAWFTRASDWRSARLALKRAAEFAETDRLKLAIRFMSVSLTPAQSIDIGNGNPTAIMYRLSDLIRLIPHRVRYRRLAIADGVEHKLGEARQSSFPLSECTRKRVPGMEIEHIRRWSR